jgi:hypothetical protein
MTIFEQATKINYTAYGFPALIISYNYDEKYWSACLRNESGGFESHIRESTAEAAVKRLLDLWENWQKRKDK